MRGGGDSEKYLFSLVRLLLCLLPLCCGSPAASSPAWIIPLVEDDWHRGHELPDVVNGTIFSGHIFLRFRNIGSTTLHSVSLSVRGSSHLNASESPSSVSLFPGQVTSLHAPLRQRRRVTSKACPLRVHLVVRGRYSPLESPRPASRVDDAGEDEDNEVEIAAVQHRLLCRSLNDRFTFVYIDVDGSPQIAAAKFPSPAIHRRRKGSESGSEGFTTRSVAGHDRSCRGYGSGCAVVLSTHGMDVTAQRQADCYQPRVGFWILAPHGRGTHAFNWQGPGHWSARAALDELDRRADAWTLRRRRKQQHMVKGVKDDDEKEEEEEEEEEEKKRRLQYNEDMDVRLSQLGESKLRRVAFTGHSNGAFGAWTLGTLHPDEAIAVAPLSGMPVISTSMLPDLTPSSASAVASTSTSCSPTPANATKMPSASVGAGLVGLLEIMSSSVGEYTSAKVYGSAGNLLSVPFLARTGAEDSVIHPSATWSFAELLQAEHHRFGLRWSEQPVPRSWEGSSGEKSIAKSSTSRSKGKMQQGRRMRDNRDDHDDASDGSVEWRLGSEDVGECVLPHGFATHRVVQLARKGHWWWDTFEANDGGVMDDPMIRAFFNRSLFADRAASIGAKGPHCHLGGNRRSVETTPNMGQSSTFYLEQQALGEADGGRDEGDRSARENKVEESKTAFGSVEEEEEEEEKEEEKEEEVVHFACGNLASCGSSRGIRMLQQKRPAHSVSPSRFSLRISRSLSPLGIQHDNLGGHDDDAKPPLQQRLSQVTWKLQTTNLARFSIDVWALPESRRIYLDGQLFTDLARMPSVRSPRVAEQHMKERGEPLDALGKPRQNHSDQGQQSNVLSDVEEDDQVDKEDRASEALRPFSRWLFCRDDMVGVGSRIVSEVWHRCNDYDGVNFADESHPSANFAARDDLSCVNAGISSSLAESCTSRSGPSVRYVPACCRTTPERSAEDDGTTGPLRRVLARPFVIVYGSSYNVTASALDDDDDDDDDYEEEKENAAAVDRRREHMRQFVEQQYRNEAMRFANDWYATGGGVAVVMADHDFLPYLNSGNETVCDGELCSGGGVGPSLLPKDPSLVGSRGDYESMNIIVIGGPMTNRVAKVLATYQPVRFLQHTRASNQDRKGRKKSKKMSPRASKMQEYTTEGQTRRAEAVAQLGARTKLEQGGFVIGPYEFRKPGTGLVSLGPRYRPFPAKEDRRPLMPRERRMKSLVAVVAGTTVGGFRKATELFRSNLFVINSWQHFLPEYVVAGPSYKTGRSSPTTTAGIAAAGYWGNNWEYRRDAAFTACSEK